MVSKQNPILYKIATIIKAGDTIKVGSKIMKVVDDDGVLMTPYTNPETGVVSNYRLSGWNSGAIQLIK